MRNLDLLIPRESKPTERWTWATVTWTDPLRIRLDGESNALDITPENLAGQLVPGDRVWVQVSGRRTFVVGRSGGTSGVPTGAVSMFMTDVAPAGWLMCDGSLFDPVAYPALRDLLGVNKTPDMRLRFPLGMSPGLNLPGWTGGSPSIGLSQLPSHTHSISHDHANATTSTDGNHTHTYHVTPQTGSGMYFPRGQTSGKEDGSGSYALDSAGNHNHTVNIPAYSGNSGAAGSGQDYWQPFVVVNFIIKT